jgi:hypothetical protein
MGENPEQLDVPILMIDDIWQLINQLPCASVATEEQTSADFRVYPNPADERWVVSGCSSSCTWSVYDLTGKEIASGKTTGGSSFNIESSFIPSGCYVLQLEQNGHLYRMKITR